MVAEAAARTTMQAVTMGICIFEVWLEVKIEAVEVDECGAMSVED